MMKTPKCLRADLCSSLTDFWSRRWNLTAGNALRFLVYDPISEGRLIRRAGSAPTTSRAVRRAGVVASFVVSGMVHELIFWCALFLTPHAAHTRGFTTLLMSCLCMHVAAPIRQL